nr:hypothetical protein [Candidatus Moranbacteria bacterium]
MNTRFLFKGVDIDERTRDYILKRLGRLEKLVDSVSEFEVEIERSKHGKDGPEDADDRDRSDPPHGQEPYGIGRGRGRQTAGVDDDQALKDHVGGERHDDRRDAKERHARAVHPADQRSR